ncbi:hypothetical protein BGV68_31915 [Burkholderia ubonensis]|nr:hypothetical protein BGV47_27385 [Burkholderia ubonensis]OJA45203.1 hypothetical protein BGV68_31915 [Burkholderia ubonensis]OJB27125.1 hypothetical protein BGV55_20005 [Burkholderia ubonensis]
MNLFVLLFNKDRTKFEEALIRTDGNGSFPVVIEELRQAEERARASFSNDVAGRASKQRYVDAIVCARVELERHFHR